MIDLNKYEGHSDSIKQWRLYSQYAIPIWVDKEDKKLIADIPLLLEEIKQLRELIKEIAQHDAKEYWSYELLQKVEMIE
tara:strand:- start:152 stop:388 length:237 start_codon:yes stop_codon:yes gene_type:complete